MVTEAMVTVMATAVIATAVIATTVMATTGLVTDLVTTVMASIDDPKLSALIALEFVSLTTLKRNRLYN